MKSSLTPMAQKKVIIKTMKTYMVKFATELLTSLDEVIKNKYGKKVLLYLLNPRDPDHVLPEIIRLLEKGDGNTHSKKDPAVRKNELLEVVSPPLLEYLCENAVTMVTDKGQSVMVRDILLSALGDLRPAMTAVAQRASLGLIPGGDSAGQRFSRILLDTVGIDRLRSWVAVNRGALVLCSLLKCVDQSVVSEVRSGMLAILPQLQKITNNKGVENLVEQLTSQ
ncbi:hypothetical protein CRUP_022498 [Coryphaenoides rupestris]|nr:hypothetical protein CRUP_022498 [Coryphaenoides rupestris]